MHLKEGYVIKEIAGENVLFPTGQAVVESGKLVSVNETGLFVVELLQQDIPYKELFQKMVERYEPEDEEEKEQMQFELYCFLGDLHRNSMLIM